jgi:hypothetical protein
MIVRIITVLLLCICSIWAWEKPGWDSISLLLGTIIAYLTMEGLQKGKPNQKDITNYEELEVLLDPNGCVSFIREHDFGDSWRSKELDPFFNYYDNWESPNHQFIDRKLEILRKKLSKEIHEFVNLIAYKTFPFSADIQGIPHEDSEGNPREYEALSKEINESSLQVCKAYDLLVLEGRKRLY